MAGQDESHTNLAPPHAFRRDTVPLDRGAVLAGRYQVETLLGRGGAGVVLRAFDRELQEAVAIKVLHGDLALEGRWIERLAREVKLARQLRHPNVCRVFDFEKADGHVFVVMELATGGSLRRELEDPAYAQRSAEDRVADARAVAEGLAAIHAAGIAHRDVTPQNVLRMSDGRLVVSDFGLATEVSQTTTSIHGGTVAYMAPEVVRGARANFASDVWSLGVVIHEIVFGARPTWSNPVGGAMLTPAPGRVLSVDERLALDVCRACTANDPTARPTDAAKVAAWLEGRAPPGRARRKRWALAALGLALLSAAVAGVVRSQRSSEPAAPARSDDLAFVGEPRDWTDTTKVLATIDDRLQCLTLLRDGRTLRYVSSQPEDLDMQTGRRARSPLVPAAYAEGCPRESPDGKHLAFQGHTQDGRAFAFVSDRADGAGAVPLVPIADPSMSSEPKWLPDGKAFTLDVDSQHMGVFSLETKRLTILPNLTTEPPLSTTRFAAGPVIAVAASGGAPLGTTVGAFQWPLLSEAARFRIPSMVMDVASRDGKTFLLARVANSNDPPPLLAVDPVARTARRLGFVRGRMIRYVTPTHDGVVVGALRGDMDVWGTSPTGAAQRLTTSGDYGCASPCGEGILATKAVSGGTEIVRMDRAGRPVQTLLRDADALGFGCSPDGAVWYFGGFSKRQGIHRCDDHGCTALTSTVAARATVSPDGQRLAFLSGGGGGITVSWMPTGGGPIRGISTTETGCDPAWSTARNLWVSRRRDGRIRWIEIDTETLVETGKAVDGSRDCATGVQDPKRPSAPPVWVETKYTTELRYIPDALLAE